MLYLTASAWDEALKKEQAKVKVIEDKYNAKILENGVSNISLLTRQHIKII